MNKLQKLIKDCNFSYANSDITEEHFPKPKKLRKGKVIVYRPTLTDGIWTSNGVLKEIKEKGYTPLNVYEMIEWFKENKDTLEDYKWYLVFDSIWKDADGYRGVPCVCRDSDGDYGFGLGYFGHDWNDDFCLLLFCDGDSLDPKIPNSNALTLDKAIEIVKEAEYKVIKEI